MNYCYLNGQVLPINEASVGVKDIGLLRGFGVYEALTTYNQKPFELEKHLERFRRSADFLKINISLSDQEIEDVIYKLIKQSGNQRFNVKFILTGGESIDGIDYNQDTPTFYIFLEDYKPIDQSLLDNGCSLLLEEYLRDLPEMKTTNYIRAVMLQSKQKKEGALESLYFWQDKVLECSTSNFFIVKDGVLVTTKDNILNGITRQTVIELAKNSGFKVEERDVLLSELWQADEAFLTASFKEVVPVVSVGGKTIGSGKVGEITKKIISSFRELTENL